MKLASATLWHFFSPWFKSAPSIRWVDRRDAQESFLTLLLITNSQKKKGHNESKFSTRPRILQVQTECTEEIWMYRMEFPHFCSPKDCGAFFGALNKKNDNDDKNTATDFLAQKNLDFFFFFFKFHFYSFFVCWRSRAASSSRHRRRLQHGWAKGKQRDGLESDKTFFRARIQTSCLGGTVSAEHLYLTHVPLFVLVPAEGTGRGYFGGLCLSFFFFFLIRWRPSNTKQNNLSVRLRLSLCLSLSRLSSLNVSVNSQSSTLCPRVTECFSPCLVFFSGVGPPPAPAGRFGGGEEAISCSLGGSWGQILFGREDSKSSFLSLSPIFF